jgi:hypothetical protein
MYHIVVFSVKGKICPRRIFIFANRLSFQATIEDLDLKYCMEGRNLKNNITGRNRREILQRPYNQILIFAITGAQIVVDAGVQ